MGVINILLWGVFSGSDYLIRTLISVFCELVLGLALCFGGNMNWTRQYRAIRAENIKKCFRGLRDFESARFGWSSIYFDVYARAASGLKSGLRLASIGSAALASAGYPSLSSVSALSLRAGRSASSKSQGFALIEIAKRVAKAPPANGPTVIIHISLRPLTLWLGQSRK